MIGPQKATYHVHWNKTFVPKRISFVEYILLHASDLLI